MAECDFYLQGGTALTINNRGDILDNALIGIKKGKIASIESSSDFKPPEGVRVVDTHDCLVMPGLVNCHTHSGMGLLRGLAEDLPLERWLEEFIFPTERRWLGEEYVYISTLVSLLEMIRTGTTTINDMYYFEKSTQRAIQEAGVRAISAFHVPEVAGIQSERDLKPHLDEYLERVSQSALLVPAIAAHAIYTVNTSTLKEVIHYGGEHQLRIHIHLSETHQEVEYAKKNFGMTPVEYGESIGLFEGSTIAAHCACLTEKDIETLGKYHVGVAHNLESNMKMATEICPVVALRKAGAHVGIATDGVASNNNLDMLQEIDMVTKLQIYREGVGKFTTKEAVSLLTIEGARALGLENEIGSLEVGKVADIIAIDVNNTHSVPLHDPYAHLIYSANGNDVKHTIVDGQVLMENQKILSLDQHAIFNEARQWGEKIRANVK